VGFTSWCVGGEPQFFAKGFRDRGVPAAGIQGEFGYRFVEADIDMQRIPIGFESGADIARALQVL
jgi:hypothetical protein